MAFAQAHLLQLVSDFLWQRIHVLEPAWARVTSAAVRTDWYIWSVVRLLVLVVLVVLVVLPLLLTLPFLFVVIAITSSGGVGRGHGRS